MWPRLREAVADMSWLLSRGYADKSSLKLVGDRFSLTERQRTAVMRCACADFALMRRGKHEVDAAALVGERLLVDGYNVLTTLEAALAGGVIIAGRDGCYRDMASMHGTFRKVMETEPALELLGEFIGRLGVSQAVWLLDRPVSNSGRLRQTILEIAEAKGWPTQAELVPDPDALLVGADGVIASADSMVLDHCSRWFNMARRVVESAVPQALVVDLSRPA
jgi:hypothetical protein